MPAQFTMTQRIERFWIRCDRSVSAACWLWTGATNEHGYGIAQPIPGISSRVAHRIAWELTHGPVIPGSVVRHTCAARACINPAHLYVASQSEKMRETRKQHPRTLAPEHAPVRCVCESCGAEFFRRPSVVAKGYGLFCSRACVGRPPEARFWSRVNKSDTCWLWTGPVDGTGRGIMGRGGKYNGVLRVHRLSWEMHNGPIPEGLVVCHRCDVPTCVNPAHLFLGTQEDNMVDMVMKDRHGLAKLKVEDIPTLRELRAQGWTYAAIGRRYGVTLATARKAVLGLCWKHVA